MRQRGVVVAIWEDVTNPTRSTRDTLQSLEAGELGPILHGDTEAGRTDEVPTYEASREFPHLADRHRESRDERTSIIGNDSSDRFSRSRRSIIDRERKQAIDKSGYIRQPDLISSLAQAQYETTPRTPLSASYPDLSNPPRAKMADREAFGQPDNQKTSGTAGTSGASASASVSVAVDDNDDSDKGKVIVKASRKKKERLSGVARFLSFRKGERRRGSMTDDSDK